MKFLSFILGLLMLLFGYFQLNDPDPYGWVVVYLATAIICFLAGMNKYYRPVIMAALVVSLLWGASLIPDFYNWIVNGADSIVGSMKAEEPHVELTREFLGLVLISAVLYFQYRQSKKLNAEQIGK